METAFLSGSLEEEIFMECSPDMTDANDDDILALTNASVVLYKQQDSITRGC